MKDSKMIKQFATSLIMFLSLVVSAQQEPQYTQYMYNPSQINPAYSGSMGYASVFGLYRTQWVGLDGAPKTANLGFHKPIENSKLGYGINILNDRIGPSELTYMNVDISYTLLFGEKSRLAFGLKVGGELINIDYSKLSQYNPGDALFQNNLNRFSPNIGAGIYYYTDNTYVGFSVPMLLNTAFYDEVAVSTADRRQNFYLIAGKVYDLNYYIKFKPALVTKIVSGAPLQLDLTANFLINEKFTAGIAYRMSAALSGLVGFQVTDQLFIGYGYDRETTRLSNFNSGSHELFLKFDLFNSHQKIETPRFF
ncbi:type IX secretion system membrane protein PorP/SprF [Flavobacterium sp.]|uniref:type IX secretion system membrane protein PorP/SprF n=1 Tax=Flavobacterium sp. TaxID=239 RepID=UPI0037BFFFE8